MALGRDRAAGHRPAFSTMAQNKKYFERSRHHRRTPPEYTSAVNYSTDYEYGGSSGFQTGSTYKVFTLAGVAERAVTPQSTDVLGTPAPALMNKFLRPTSNGGKLERSSLRVRQRQTAVGANNADRRRPHGSVNTMLSMPGWPSSSTSARSSRHAQSHSVSNRADGHDAADEPLLRARHQARSPRSSLAGCLRRQSPINQACTCKPIARSTSTVKSRRHRGLSRQAAGPARRP